MKFILPLLSNMVIGLACTAQTSNPISIKNTPITIDGSTNDWSSYKCINDEKSNVSYSITNDSKTIYFLFKFPEKHLQYKVLRAGLEIKIDTIGKTNYPISVIFPYSIDRENTDPIRHSYTGIKPTTEYEMIKTKSIESSNKIKIVGFNNGLSDVMLNIKNVVGVSAALQFDSTNTLNYELSVPINLFFESKLSNYKYPFNFQFNILGLPFSASESSDSRYFENNSLVVKPKLAF